ncbi:MAG TPA: hypothetical protein VK714_19500 [Myxococcota bacterium]|nr:hypothetical protein [Myxococcota bacterium]
MTLLFEQARDLITATRTRRRYSHSLPGYLCFVLGLFVFVPTAALLGTCGACALAIGGASTLRATHGKVGPSFSAIPVPVKSCGAMTMDDGWVFTLPCH